MPPRLQLLSVALLLSCSGWHSLVHAQLEAPIPVGRCPFKAELGRPLRDKIEGSEEDLVSTAQLQQLPPLPVDMRWPCQNPDRPCVQSVDAVYQPPPPTDAASSCSVTLMPWSSFPCKYDTEKSYGVPGQAKKDYCYDNPSSADPALGNADLATKLKFKLGGMDGHFIGKMPSSLCPGVDNPAVVKLLVKVDFRVASGNQYDRSYVLKIGDAVAVRGTTAEPALFEADKEYSVAADITHLLPYIEPGMPTKFSLGNFVDNVFNVPVWAAVTLEVYYNSASSKPRTAPPSAFGFSSSAAVPDEVLPLKDASLIGTGDSPSSWPSATVNLPSSMSQAGTIYRAQLLLTPQWGGCEEFWQLQPSGKQTGAACNGISVGEPYREIRVYVDGVLAGLYPVFYTFYTGGVNPSLWMGIVSPHAFLLPSYTYDLSPFLGMLNTAVTATPHNIKIEAFGVSNDAWSVSANLLLWRSNGLKVTGKPPTVKILPTTATRALSSKCVQITRKPVTVEGDCTLALKGRSVSATAQLTVGTVKLNASSSYEVTGYYNRIVYNNTNGGEVFVSTTAGKVSWSLVLARARRSSMRGTASSQLVARTQRALSPATTVTAASASYSWLLGGGLVPGSVYELSDNATVGQFIMSTLDTIINTAAPDQPSSYTSPSASQKHYLRARVPGITEFTQEYGLCPVPPIGTATAMLKSSVNTMGWMPSAECLTRRASAAFCYSKLLDDLMAPVPGACSK